MSSEPSRTEAAARATYEHEREPEYSEPGYDWPNIDSGYDRLDEEEDDPEWCRNIYRASARVALAAADAWDAANGYVRIRIDDATARMTEMWPHEDWCCAKGCPGRGNCPNWRDCDLSCNCLQRRALDTLVAVLTEGNTDDA